MLSELYFQIKKKGKNLEILNVKNYLHKSVITTHISYLSNVVFHIYPTVNILKKIWKIQRLGKNEKKEWNYQQVFFWKLIYLFPPIFYYETDADLIWWLTMLVNGPQLGLHVIALTLSSDFHQCSVHAPTVCLH